MDNQSPEKKEKSKKKSLINILIKYVLPLLLGVVIIYYLMRDVNMADLWLVIKEANWAILAFSLLFGLLGNIIRGYRWQLLIRPLGYNPHVSNLIFATLGGYAVNFALPRAGEVWKCGILSKEEKIPFSKLFGTMILDRVFDTITVLTITLIACIFNFRFFVHQLEHNKAVFDKVEALVKSPFLYVAIAVVVFGIYFTFKFFSNKPVIKKIKSLGISMRDDMKAIWKMKNKGRLLFYTVSIWGSYFLYFYITFFAFDFTENLGVTAGLTAFALSSISMGVPSNGGLGPWQAAVIAALALYGVGHLQSTAFATGVFATQSLWVIFCGLFGIAALSIRNSKNK